MPFVYIVECADKTLYTGYAVDVDKRIALHNAGKGAKYTKTRLPVKLCYTEECATKSEALRREFVIKKLSRQAKLKMIKML